MVVGNGQLAKAFRDFQFKDVVVFASGVADSNCTDLNSFIRERELLKDYLINLNSQKIVYFSSCAVSALEYPKNQYYIHKCNVEELIKEYTNNYYIIRLPQLFGSLIDHKTIINYFYNAIKENKRFKVYDDAYRYVIEINDVRLLVERIIEMENPGITINIANYYRYHVKEIINALEQLLNKKANYELMKVSDKYLLNLDRLRVFMENNNIDLRFGKDYLLNKLKDKIIEADKLEPQYRMVI